ncbi:MAG: EGF domain-containing protein [Myxococcota bacterium]|nr:EGF domain-containing protein [Myxococcota bacterium]
MTLRWILALALLLAPACALVEDTRLPAPCDPPCDSPLVCNDLTGECVDSFCGNGKVEAGEACDSGPQNSDSTPGACRKNCILAGCGDSVIDPGEACDDGNDVDGDYCSATCVHYFGFCGDGVLSVEAGEACDDGNTNARDYCSPDCKRNTGSCGDSTRQKNERCDDGNLEAGDYCAPDCQTITGSCGDDLKQDNEVCDDGNRLGADYCSWDCKAITGSCGDMTLQVNEVCDDGNLLEGDYCSSDCQTKTGSCGDNVRQTNEVCDDGNDDNGDSCLSSCVCNRGYTSEGDDCVDVNECSGPTSPCDANAICTNTSGSYECVCSSGYSGNGTNCRDINECALGTHSCSTNATCTNTSGSFQCACRTGYSGDGLTCDADSALEQCNPGETKDVDCNTCDCVDGMWACTEAICAQTCSKNDDCSDDEFCLVSDGSCAAGEGICAFVPEVCTTYVQPVCGCDGNDYTSACVANAEGVNVAKEGKCDTDPGGCPGGAPPFSCLRDPCDLAECKSHPNAVCEANYCGGCNAVFYDSSGEVVTCDDQGGEVCVGDQVFRECGSACTPTCEEPTPMCTKQCVRRCECPGDKPLWHEQECITQASCPVVELTCVVDGEDYLPGDLTPRPAGQPNCAICTCGDNATVSCDLSGCSSCTVDEDCLATHWCRPTSEGGRECTPYQQEGESCGGYTPEWARRRCDPSLSCGGMNPQIPDLPGTCMREDTPITCRQDGRNYQPGDVFAGAGDNWCNCCSCTDSGGISCTRMACQGLCADDSECSGSSWCRPTQRSSCASGLWMPKTCTPFAREGEACGGYVAPYMREQCEPHLDCVSDNLGIADLPGTCRAAQSISCEPGALGLAEDGCNDCLCMETGEWYCNDTACSSSCVTGEEKTSPDGCNQCGCSNNNQWYCTMRGCGGCTPGESRLASDNCNTCMCVPKGAPSKSDFACAECLEGGGTWQPEAMSCTTNCEIMDISCYREVCPVTDSTAGRWVCTELPGCAETCPAPKDFSGVCTQNVVWAMNPVTGTCCTYPNPCVVPEGMGAPQGNENACLNPHGQEGGQND